VRAAAFIALLAPLVACGRPSPAVERGGAASRAEAKAPPCAACHAEIDAEWRASYHRVAFTDATFQKSLALEEQGDRGFCVACHAPERARADGIGCASCHARPHEHAPSAGATCARCHEFTFDHGRGELVQKTVSEHADSSFAAVACVECHAPPRAGHTDHRFASGHSPAFLSRAVHVEGTRSGPNALTLAIRVDAGHAFPTGDMFRRARLLVFAENADGRIVADAERIFGRTWGGVQGREHAGARTQTADTRIRESWSEVFSFDDAPAPIARVRWTLLFERAVSVRGPHVDLVSSDEIAHGETAW
jgi:hypothetical protein